MTQRFLVIGSNSFSGAQFVKYLLQHQHKVLGVSRSLEPHKAFLPYKWLPNVDKLRFVQIDINN